MHSNNWLALRIDNFKEKRFDVIDTRGGAHNLIPYEERLQIHTFIDNHLKIILLESPAKGVNLLPSSFAFDQLYTEYRKSGGSRSFTALYSHFKDFWPDVRKITHYSDYCNTCFLQRKLIKAAADPEEKLEHQAQLDHHRELASIAREYYKIVNIGKSKLSDEKDFMCLSFDWAQNYELPKFIKQPGELYFFSRQKVGIFGITNEKPDAQTFYCLPEKELDSYGKGPNATLSFVYHYLMSLPKLPKKLVLYCDNCVAQNKNHYTLWFLHWLCYSLQVIDSVELNFLVPGHTKFSPDRHFGLSKIEFNRTDSVEPIPDVLRLIENSTEKNEVVCVRNWETGIPNVRIYDWKTFLSQNYRKAPSRLKLFSAQTFRIKSSSMNIEYRKNHLSEPMNYKARISEERVSEANVELAVVVPGSVPDSRIGDLKKVEKFVTPQKLQEFWKAIDSV